LHHYQEPENNDVWCLTTSEGNYLRAHLRIAHCDNNDLRLNLVENGIPNRIFNLWALAIDVTERIWNEVPTSRYSTARIPTRIGSLFPCKGERVSSRFYFDFSNNKYFAPRPSCNSSVSDRIYNGDCQARKLVNDDSVAKDWWFVPVDLETLKDNSRNLSTPLATGHTIPL